MSVNSHDQPDCHASGRSSNSHEGDGLTHSGAAVRRSPLARMLIAGVVFYQTALSPLKMGSSCRFEPTCSAYALDAVRTHGGLKGFSLTAVRLAKCGPWHPGGFDPVPGMVPHANKEN